MGHGSLRESYPATISMGQLYRICHISKRKARWLLEQGIIPCVDSGKKTRRFSIQLEDVIIFLERRDAGCWRMPSPEGFLRAVPVPSARPGGAGRGPGCAPISWNGGRAVRICSQFTRHRSCAATAVPRSTTGLDAGKIKGLNYRRASPAVPRSLWPAGWHPLGDRTLPPSRSNTWPG